jgi:hypothetical protein
MLILDGDPIFPQECVGQRYPEFAGQVAVARPCSVQFTLLFLFVQSACLELRGDRGEGLNGVSHLVAGQAVISPATLMLDRYDTAVDEFRQMVAGGLGRNAGSTSEFPSRNAAAIHQSKTHCGPRSVTEQTGHEGNIRVAGHPFLQEACCSFLKEHFSSEYSNPPTVMFHGRSK